MLEFSAKLNGFVKNGRDVVVGMSQTRFADGDPLFQIGIFLIWGNISRRFFA